MKVKAPFSIATRIPPYRKAQMWNKRLMLRIFGCQRTPSGALEELQAICFHWADRWKLAWSGGGSREGTKHYRDHRHDNY